MTVDSVVKRLMITAISSAIGDAPKRAKANGIMKLKNSLEVTNGADFRMGMICGEANARMALMVRMYMGREPTGEESEALLGLLADRSNDVRDALYRKP